MAGRVYEYITQETCTKREGRKEGKGARDYLAKLPSPIFASIALGELILSLTFYANIARKNLAVATAHDFVFSVTLKKVDARMGYV